MPKKLAYSAKLCRGLLSFQRNGRDSKLKTEAFKSFDHGFLLSEAELRRLIDIVQTQMKRACEGREPQLFFSIKFDNGALSTTKSLDDVLSLENFGSGAVIRLEVIILEGGDPPTDVTEEENFERLLFQPAAVAWAKTLIKLSFLDKSQPNMENRKPISYAVKGQDRDWVFVTSSQLDERISKIKVFSLARFASIKFLVSVIPILLGAVVVLSFLPFATDAHQIDTIEHDWQTGKIKDPVAVMIAFQRMRYARPPDAPFLFLGLLYALTVAFPPFLVWAFPAYTFYWGDRIATYDKRKAARSFILGGVIVALLVATLAGYIVNRFHLGL